MPNRRRLTDAERDHRREQDRQRLHHATEQLLNSDGWQRWVRVRSRNGLARYSINNQLLIALAMPDASYVCGFRAWLGLGYQVRKGEKAIRIMAPMPIKTDTVTDQGAETDGGHTRPRMLFRVVPVFDRSQVDPIPGETPTPLDAPCEPLSGDSHARLLVPLEVLADSLGFVVAFEQIPGATGGWCDQQAKRIVVDAGLPGNGRVRVLVHELAHALGVGYREYGRERAEVIVDTVTFIVCAGAGLDIAGDSVPYVAGWGETGALDAVTEFAGAIDTIARRLETAIQPPEDNAIADAEAAAAA